MGNLNAKIDFARLESKLREEGFDRVIMAARLCAPEGWTKVREQMTDGIPRTVLVGACAEEFFGVRMQKYGHEAGLFGSAWGFVDLGTGVDESRPAEAADVCANGIFSCAARMRRAERDRRGTGGELAACLAEQVEALKTMGPNPFRE
jgi:hypothetical protein